MRRRAAIALLAGAALAAAGAAAQSRPGVPRIAVLDWESAGAERMAPFRQALRELGHVEGETIQVAYHFAEGRLERAEALAAEIVRDGVDIIVAFTTPAVRAVKRATSTIPIVGSSADPVGSGLITNLARPEGNLTGVSNMMTDLESKRMELLREIIPDLRRIAFLGSSRDPAAPSFVRQTRAAAERIGARLEVVLVADAGEIDAALAALARDQIEAVIVQPLFALDTRAATRLAAMAARHRVPVIATFLNFPRAGGLMSYGPNPAFGPRAVARYVDRILKGARPGDLPVEQPTHFELVLNLATARSLGITIPTVVLLRADEVIE